MNRTETAELLFPPEFWRKLDPENRQNIIAAIDVKTLGDFNPESLYEKAHSWKWYSKKLVRVIFLKMEIAQQIRDLQYISYQMVDKEITEEKFIHMSLAFRVTISHILQLVDGLQEVSSQSGRKR